MNKISVIVPVYNVEAYLKGCLDSIVSQDYPSLEIILVNDGSTDHSGQICQQYANQDSRIKVINQKNMGTSAAKNTGLSAATGDLITFVDADDWYTSKDSISTLYQLMQEKQADISAGNFNEFDDQSNKYLIHVFAKHPARVIMNSREWFKNEYRDEEAISQCFSTPWGKLFKREYFKNLRFPVGKIDEDDLTMWKTFLQADRIAYTNQPLYVYRNHRANSITAVANNAQLFSLPAIEQRITMEQRLHFTDILPEEISAYLWRLQMHRNNALKVGEASNFKQAQQTINIINKRNNANY